MVVAEHSAEALVALNSIMGWAVTDARPRKSDHPAQTLLFRCMVFQHCVQDES
jgi:hypothetical protein